MEINNIAIEILKPNPHNAHNHSKKQISQIAESIRQFGFVVPILVDEKFVILSGHGRYEAGKLLGLRVAPVIQVQGLSASKKRAFILADNKVAENASWDGKLLAIELAELSALLIEGGLDITITGFTAPEFQRLTTDFTEQPLDAADPVEPDWAAPAPVSMPGDLWQLGQHRLLVGDACGEDARLVDIVIRHWQKFARRSAIHAELGRTFDELSHDRDAARADACGRRPS